jgi:hypothetical protein
LPRVDRFNKSIFGRRDGMEREEIASRLAGLSPARRALLERRLRPADGPASSLDQLIEGSVATAVAIPDSPTLSPLSPAARAGDLPLSFAQQRLWLLDQLEPGGSAYNSPFALALEGPLDLAVLAATFAEIVRRHEVLRTRFRVPARGGLPVQVIGEPWAPPLPVASLEDLPPHAARGEMIRVAKSAAARPFDLENGPLVRLLVLGLGSRRHVLVATLHHIVSDGWSAGLLQREIAALYGAFARGERSPLPPLAVQYADFAVWQRAWFQGEVLAEHLAYWRRL